MDFNSSILWISLSFGKINVGKFMTTGHCSVPLKMFSLAQMDVSGQKWHLDLVVCVQYKSMHCKTFTKETCCRGPYELKRTDYLRFDPENLPFVCVDFPDFPPVFPLTTKSQTINKLTSRIWMNIILVYWTKSSSWTNPFMSKVTLFLYHSFCILIEIWKKFCDLTSWEIVHT